MDKRTAKKKQSMSATTHTLPSDFIDFRRRDKKSDRKKAHDNLKLEIERKKQQLRMLYGKNNIFPRKDSDVSALFSQPLFIFCFLISTSIPRHAIFSCLEMGIVRLVLGRVMPVMGATVSSALWLAGRCL